MCSHVCVVYVAFGCAADTVLCLSCWISIQPAAAPRRSPQCLQLIIFFFRTYYYMLRCLFLFCFEPNTVPYTQILQDVYAHHKPTRAFLDFITSCWAAILLLFDTIQASLHRLSIYAA